MKPVLEDLKKKLKLKNIHLSYQRLKVLEYLIQNQCHPTVDQIFIGLQKSMPSLSKTTVYNTLHILLEAELVKAITIDDSEIRYDIITELHGHFKCQACGKIFNFNINEEVLFSEDLNNFKINDRDVYFKGVCPGCLLNINKTM